MTVIERPRWGQHMVTLYCDEGHEVVAARSDSAKARRLLAGDYGIDSECVVCGGVA